MRCQYITRDMKEMVL